ncbi:prolyl oligopeptidase family serine peptidase [uncultured Eudoraea sp.]|uniref:prolyl oligopeptidase family serine peptidase n=1 Tax=uncultured Eudoraea sp. TaxID=1035614 RepID=UPI002609941D|nr:prolyl oligopeptidase family serine peptidase [uncultured Eudoraea sp.]
MRKLIPLLALLMFGASCKKDKRQSITLTYPETATVDTVDTYFGTEVPDPFRWLEDDMSDETAEWVGRQNEVTFNYLNEIPYREDLKNRLEKLWSYEKITSPFKEGKYTYYHKNDGLQDQYVVYRRKDGASEDEVFLDPNEFSEDGTTSLSGMYFTKDGSIMAYTISEGGSDWRKAIVMDAETKEVIGDTLVDLKFSGISWYGNDGFYYSSYEKPDGSELSAKTDQHIVYYHKLNTDQSADEIIYGKKPEEKHRYIGTYISDDQEFIFLSLSTSTSGNKLYFKSLNDDSLFKPIQESDSADTWVIDNEGPILYIVTNYEAPNQRLVKTNISYPTAENWEDVIPESENVLSVRSAGGSFFAEYMIDALSKVYQYDYEGNFIREVKLPGIGTIWGFGDKKDVKEVYFVFTNYSLPSSIYKYQIEEGSYEKYWSPEIDYNPDNYESHQVFYNSKDGTKVPMIITHKKGVEYDGKNPTILYGYGGFDISITPAFSITNVIWMEQGGIYAVPNIRGGGEYGKIWHEAGIKTKKQNVFDDFIAAAEYLIENNYTSSDYLAIRGGSNGGLLVGATMTQRPDLMKVALPAVGVLDMLRYHKFTAGAGWAYDYGTSEESQEMFEYLLGYSPVHNVNQGTSYPATLITTGDHDDRVVPAHSFKFAANLQKSHEGESPTLIRIETKAGHGAGTPVSKRIEQYADIFGFTFFNMGYDELPNQAVLKEFKE